MVLNSYMTNVEQKYFLRNLYQQIDAYIKTEIAKPYDSTMTELLVNFESYAITPDTGDESEDEIQREYNHAVMEKIYRDMDADIFAFLLERCTTNELGFIDVSVSSTQEFIEEAITYALSELVGVTYGFDEIAEYKEPIYVVGANKDVNAMRNDCFELVKDVLEPIRKEIGNVQSKLYSNEELVNLYRGIARKPTRFSG